MSTKRAAATAAEKAGEYPFARGIYPDMYRTKKPTIRQFAGHGLATHTNERFKKIISLGGPQAGLSTAFDLPTLYGDDSDSRLSKWEVGWDGVAIDTLSDMENLFSEIPIDKLTVSMTINAPAAIIMAMYIAAAEKRGIYPSHLCGTIQNDILKEYIAQNEYIYPLKHGMRLGIDLMEYSSRYMPKWHPVSISGYHIREAGSSAVQEVAYTHENGITYADALLKRGLKVEDFAPKFSFFFDVHNNFFEEIAKFRAARMLWAEIMHKKYRMPIPDNYNLKDPKLQALWCRIHAQTAGCTLTRNQPMNNIVRVSYQALAALLGGAQSIHTNSYDEVLCVPTERSVKAAIRTQQILLEETGIPDFIDPLGGSELIECLTDKIYEEAKKEISIIESLGGMEDAIAESYPQRKIHEHSIEERRKNNRIVGENIYVDENENLEMEITDIVEEVELRRGFEEEQKKRLFKVKKERSQSAMASAISSIKLAAERKENIMPVLIAAVKTQATLGEICGALRDVWGEADEAPNVSTSVSYKEALEITKGYKFPKPVRILMAKAGHDGHTRGFYILRDIFRAMGAEVIHLGLRASPEAIAKAAAEEDVQMVGLSAHIGYVPGFFKDLQENLKSFGRRDIEIIGGGIMLPQHERIIKEKLGIKKLFVPGPTSDFSHIIESLKEKYGDE